MSESWIGYHSGQRITSVEPGELSEATTCLACGSADVHITRTHEPLVNYLEPIVGAPYPTFAADWTVHTECRCRNCSAKWGHTVFGEPCLPEDLPFDIYTHKRMDKEFADNPIYR